VPDKPWNYPAFFLLLPQKTTPAKFPLKAGKIKFALQIKNYNNETS